MQPLLISSGISIGVYAVTRTISYLSTTPAPGDSFFHIRSSLAQFQSKAQDCFGRKWNYWSDMYWDNLWISAFAVSLLLTINKIPIVASVNLIGSCIVFGLGSCTLAWMTRLALANMFPRALGVIRSKISC